MKRTFTLFGLSLLLSAAPLFAQKAMDQANERAVQITSGPSITNITGNSATVKWTTNSSGANHVRYRVAGSNSAWQSATHPGGGTSHSLQLTGLQLGKTYEWQILTNDGDLRTAGQFQSAATATGTAPDVNANASGSSSAQGIPAQGAGPSGPKVALYRSVSNKNGGHLYSTSANDQAGSYKQEGVTGYLMTSQQSGTEPLYRMTNAQGDMVLATDASLRSTMQGHGYRDEGIVGYVSTAQASGTQPLYQLSSADGASHLYTTSASERDQVIGRGWKDQGTVGYVWSQQ